VSAGPWQGLDATASAEREPIRRVWGGARSGGPGSTAPGGGSGGFAEPVLGVGGEVGPCSTNQSYKRSSGVITLHRRRKGSVVGGGHHGECGARAYNGGLGAEPLVRGGAKPP